MKLKIILSEGIWLNAPIEVEAIWPIDTVPRVWGMTHRSPEEDMWRRLGNEFECIKGLLEQYLPKLERAISIYSM